MEPLVWDDRFAIGDLRVDDQHRRLFELYSKVAGAPARAADREQLIHELYSYAVFHFSEEEALMATVRYPDFEAHQWLHKSFFDALKPLLAGTPEAALVFFRDWLVNHILTEDRKIGRFLAENPVP